MTRIDEIKKFAQGVRGEHNQGTLARIDSLIDAAVEDVQTRSDLNRSEIEESITRFTIHGKEQVFELRLAGGLGHGPIPIPHDCHTTIMFCWPHPTEDIEVCVEIEIPWPCPD